MPIPSTNNNLTAIRTGTTNMTADQDLITTLTLSMSKLTLASPTPAQHSTFLTLPSELRQAILINTFTPHPLSSDDADITHSALWTWAGTLRQVHTDIKGDVNYVEKKWEDEAERLEKAVFSWKKTRAVVDRLIEEMTWPASRKWGRWEGPGGVGIRWNDTCE